MTALDLCGGDVVLDFVNTLGGLRDGPWDDEWLVAYDDLAAWSGHAGLLPAAAVDHLRARAAGESGAAAATHADGVALREALHVVLAALARGSRAPDDALAAVAAAHRAALACGRFAMTAAGAPPEAGAAHRHSGAPPEAGTEHRHAGAPPAAGTAQRHAGAPRGTWTWDADDDLRRPLWPLALAAVDLLRSDRLARLRQCGTCRWLFLDASRNGSRRWCSMAHCGTGAKVSRARARRQAGR